MTTENLSADKQEVAEFYQPAFGIEYKMPGTNDVFVFNIPADSFEDAEAKLEAIKQSGVVYGQVK